MELYSRRTEGTANIWIWFQIFQEWLLCWYIIINEMKRIWTSFMNLFCSIYLAVSIFCNFHVIVQVIHLHTVLPTSISFAIIMQAVCVWNNIKNCHLLFVLVLVHNYHSWVKVCPREPWTIWRSQWRLFIVIPFTVKGQERLHLIVSVTLSSKHILQLLLGKTPLTRWPTGILSEWGSLFNSFMCACAVIEFCNLQEGPQV